MPSLHVQLYSYKFNSARSCFNPRELCTFFLCIFIFEPRSTCLIPFPDHIFYPQPCSLPLLLDPVPDALRMGLPPSSCRCPV